MGVQRECSTSELAIYLGITIQAIARLSDKGVLSRTSRGRYDLPGSIRSYLQYRERTAVERAGGGGSLTSGRARKLALECAKLEAEQKIRENSYISLERMEAHWTAVLQILRSALLAMPRKLAPQIGRMRSAEDAEALLRREVHTALNKLAVTDYRPPDAARAGAAADDAAGRLPQRCIA